MKNYNKNPKNLVSHPGAAFRTGFMEQFRSIIDSAMSLEDGLELPRGTLVRFINEQESVTQNLSEALEKLTGTTASQWLTMQDNYNKWLDATETKLSFLEGGIYVDNFDSRYICLGVSRSNNDYYKFYSYDDEVIYQVNKFGKIYPGSRPDIIRLVVR